MLRLLLISFLLICVHHVIAHPAYGIVMDQQGNLYFADIMHNGRGTLWKLDKNKKLTAVLRDFHAHNVNVGRDGNIYSAHGEETHTLVRIAPSGEVDTLIIETDISKFFGGSCSVSPDGDVYFGIDRKIWLWSEDGIRSVIDGELKWNQGFYVGESGKIYATEIGLGRGGCLIEIDTDGSQRIIAERLIDVGDRDFDPTHEVLLGVNQDENGNLYVCDLGGKRVAMINSKGSVSTFYRSTDEWKPCGIFFGEEAEYILEIGKDWKGPRIIKKDGSSTEVYFDFDTHQNSPKVIPIPDSINIPWELVAVIFPIMFFIIYQLRIRSKEGIVNIV